MLILYYRGAAKAAYPGHPAADYEADFSRGIRGVNADDIYSFRRSWFCEFVRQALLISRGSTQSLAGEMSVE